MFLFARNRRSRHPGAPACLLALLLAATASADEDQDRARAAFEQGQIKALSEVISTLGDRIDGDIVSTELEREDGLWIYEIKYVDRAGRLVEILVDARSIGVIEAGEDD